MIYTKIQFGKDLKEKLLSQAKLLEISEWAWSKYSLTDREQSKNFDDVIEYLDLMSFGPKFEMTHYMLNQIAEDLILGLNVDVRSPKYRDAPEEKK